MSEGVVMLPVAVRLVVDTPDKASIGPVDVIFDTALNTSVFIHPVADSVAVSTLPPLIVPVAVRDGVVMLLYSNRVGKLVTYLGSSLGSGKQTCAVIILGVIICLDICASFPTLIIPGVLNPRLE